ncbi:MAG: hypothetical protein HY902_04760 [Deltaproteobacteria bacterium]|nr:hypothetical protein [Deltaproteobacteria bacterium]
MKRLAARAFLATAVLVSGLGLLPSCSVVKKSMDCRALSKAVNPHMRALRATSRSLGPTSTPAQVGAAYAQMANDVTASAAAVAALDLGTPELADLSQRYQAMCASSATAFRGMTKATEALTKAQQVAGQHGEDAKAALEQASALVRAATAEVQRASEPETSILQQINALCGSD